MVSNILAADRYALVYDSAGERVGIATLLQDLDGGGIGFRDLNTEQVSLEDIFVDLAGSCHRRKTEGVDLTQRFSQIGAALLATF